MLCYNSVTDNSGQSSGAAKMTLTIRDCNYLDIFQVPSDYPPLTVSYNYVHVSEDGPNFGNTRTPFHKVQVNTNMDQFVMEFDESPYYLDLKQCMSASTVSSPAFISLSGCGISGLDGVYWIRQDNGNSIWVEKNNAWAIVFTNDANFEPEFCRSDGPPSSLSGVPTARPSPVSSILFALHEGNITISYFSHPSPHRKQQWPLSLLLQQTAVRQQIAPLLTQPG